MTVALILTWDGDAAQLTTTRLSAVLASVPGLRRALLHRPADWPEQEARAPALVLQLEFDALASLQAACAAEGDLQVFPELLSGMEPASQQAFRLRRYVTPEPAGRVSYLVHYPGPALSASDWLDHYASHHIPLMQKLPALREMEMLTPIDHVSALPFPQANHMQRNRVAFDSLSALAAALRSSVRDEMRADVAEYPPYRGGVFHFAMQTGQIVPARKESSDVA
ncbi:EthD family reductase [Paracoccus aurantiacus]|uniref:EthD family reductase n=1 Tax=Paracoccus aurantiacus TaxID=2599412 RepID=A0A5C6RYN9_9RHOB|nr:EthD family reductase [Paracoccus aurantiacus]TXB67726.1 EthD family reductase [Paracoccus aurantiacus]